MRSRPLSASIRRALALATAAGFAAGPALAQDVAADETELDTIEVTGSRLKRADIEGAVPVTVIDRAQIDASGDISVAELLRDTPFAAFGNFKPQSGSSAQSLATIDLRGLGSGRTLVLVDGRRAPANPMSASSGADLNAIPMAAVERIEILTDGASAVYGSDAIGGVVNIILRKDFNGAELRYGRGHSRTAGGDTEEMSVVIGSSSDRTSVIGGASSSKRGMVFTRDQIGGDTLGVSQYGNNYYNWDTGAASPVPGFACDQGAFYFLGNGLCSFNFNSVAANEASVDNKAVFVRGEHQINDDWSLYFTATTTKVETFGRYAPVPGIVRVDDGTPNDINSGVVCGTGGCAANGLATDGLATYFYHRFAAAGNRDNFTDAQNSDYVLGFQGRLGDRIGIDFGLRRTDYKYVELGRGYVVGSLAAQAANAGDYLFTDPFGADAAVLDGFTATISRESRARTDEIYAIANVDLFEMGGGLSNAVFGAEYREDDFVDQYDSLSEAGVVLGSAGNSAGGGRDVKAAFFEWLLPFAHGFDITLAGRWDSYSDYGSDFSPKIALRWQALDNLTFRGSFGQGFRAPALDILTQEPNFSAEPVNDPQTCAALGQPTDCQTQVDTFFFANAELTSENTDQWGVGVVWDPTEWLGVSLDYYAVRIEDQITQYSAQDVINSDLQPAIYGPPPPGIYVVRNAAGRITSVRAGYANNDALDTRGLDLKVDARFDGGDWGEFASSLAATYVLDYTIENFSFESDYLRVPGYPKLRGMLTNTWNRGDFAVAWNVNHIGRNGSGAGAIGGYTTHDLQLSWKAPCDGTISVGATNVFDKYPMLAAFDGRPWNFYLYDAYGRTTYLRYTQAF